MTGRRLDMASMRAADTDVIGTGLGTSGHISFLDDRDADCDENGALVTSAINRSLLASTPRPPAPAGILVTDDRPRRRRQLALIFRDEPEVIGVGGETPSSDDEPDADDDAECAEPSAMLSPEERAFETLTKRNTDFNSISSNLSGTSRTLVDWVDENDRTTERSALTGRHKKFTPLVSVAPFSTGRGPGHLKVNPVAPMQNGELVPSGRRRPEMVERGVTAAMEKTKLAGHMVTRLDESPKTSGDEETSEEDDGTEGPPSANTKWNDSDRVEMPGLCSEAKLDTTEADGSEQEQNQRPFVVSENSVGDNSVRKPPLKRADVHRDAKLQNTDAIKKGSSEPSSNISAIKLMLAEKANWQKDSAARRSHGKMQERNMAKLNCLDGISKGSKFKSASPKADLSEQLTAGEKCANSSSSVFPHPADTSETAGRDVTSEKSDSAGGFGEKGETSIADNKRKQLQEGPGSPNLTSAERFEVKPGDTEVGCTAKPTATGHKPTIPGDKPRLSAKPGQVREPRHPTLENGSRMLSLDTAGVVHAPSAAEKSELRARVDMQHRSKNAVPLDSEQSSHVRHSKGQNEVEKAAIRQTKSLGDETAPRDEPKKGCQQINSSYSPKSSIHKDSETKTQRAMKREQELEKKREELEKRNREKKAQERSEQTLETEPCASRGRRDAPKPEHSPPSPHQRVSAFHSQLKTDLRPRGSREKESSHRPSGKVAHLATQRAEQSRPGRLTTRDEPPAEARSSFSTDTDEDEDDDDDRPPAALARACSVSPRSRKRGSQAVSFAPGTEAAGRRPGAAKPRSQSVPRPAQLDASVMRDDQVHLRLGGEQRRSRRDEPRSRGRFSLKKLLKFGRDEKRRDKDQVYGEFRAKPEIIHPIDRAGVGRVEVINRTAEQRRRDDDEQRRRRDWLVAEGTVSYDSTPTARGPHQTAARLTERPPAAMTSSGQRASTGLTAEGRPKPPPPPPPPSCRQAPDGSRPPPSPPTRPPPPNPHLLTRSRDRGRPQSDTNYANLGASRAGLTPKKPDRARPAAHGHTHTRDVTVRDKRAAPEADTSRHHPYRVSLRKPGPVVPDRLEDSYDAVTASNLQALRQLLEQTTRCGPVPAPLKRLRLARLALRQFEVAPHSRLAVGPHVLVEARHEEAGATVLVLTGGAAAAVTPPLSVPALASFTDTVPAPLLDSGAAATDDHVLATVHVIAASRVQSLSSMLASQPAVTTEADERAVCLLLLQTVRQLLTLEARGQPAIDESLHQIVALSVEGDSQRRLAAVLTNYECVARPLSACQAALAVMLRLLGVSEASGRARDGRAVSSVPDVPSITAFELLASLLQRDDSRSLRRAAAVLECLLWAPAELAVDDAPRWLHLERAALLGSAVRDQPLDVVDQLKLAFLANADADSLRDASELISI